MPIPNSTTISSEVSEESTSKPNVSASSATSEVASRNTSPIVAIGRKAAIGLRKMPPTRSRISTKVAAKVIVSALPNDSSVSTTLAASPVRPACRPLPASRPCRLVAQLLDRVLDRVVGRFALERDLHELSPFVLGELLGAGLDRVDGRDPGRLEAARELADRTLVGGAQRPARPRA